MQISVQINLAAGDAMTKSAQEIAEQILTDVGADPAKDSCYVTVTDVGNAAPPPPVPVAPDTPEPAIGPPAGA